MLPIIPIDEIPYAIDYIREKFEADLKDSIRSKFDSFWDYFNKTWLKYYDPKTWNISENVAGVQQRTNNALERFNITMNL